MTTTCQRLVGIDLGIKTSHTVVVVDDSGDVLCRRRCRPETASLATIETAALAGAPQGTRLTVVLEPTGPAWLPVAVFFARRGHTVFRVASAKAAALRRFLSRYAKSNQIDAEVLARLPLLDPAGVIPLELADRDMAALQRRVRAADRLTDEIVSHKTRLRDLARQAFPLLDTAVSGELAKCDIAVLARYGNPHRLLRAGHRRVTALITQVSRGYYGADRAQQWLDVARAAVDLYGDGNAVGFDDLADEMATQARLIELLETERARHAAAREAAYQRVDPDGLARSLPGVAAIGGPVLCAAMGRPGRFRDAAAFKSFAGLAPRASETGDTDRKGQPISKAGPAWLRDQLLQSANTARRVDPDLAAIYHRQMVSRGAHHNKALTVVAARLAERAWTVMARGTPYQLRDLSGAPINPADAKQLIADHLTVPEEIRACRRSRKTPPRPPRVRPATPTTPDLNGLPDASTTPVPAPILTAP